MGGSTTCALNLLGLLARQDTQITVVATTALSRSPRLWFRIRSPFPSGIELFAPGYLRLGKIYLNLLSFKAWARALSRASARWQWLTPLQRLVQKIYGDDLYSNVWDLTTPTEDEREAALVAIQRRQAMTVITNYAFWAPLFDEIRLRGVKRVVLMHDLLSARVERFRAAGTPLDCPDIDETTEMSWLNRADTVLAVQLREAEEISRKVRSKVLVQPMVFEPKRMEGKPQAGQCLFVGANIQPNRTGVTWLLNEVWPKVRAARPDAVLGLAGTICKFFPQAIEGVEKLGLVDSLAAEYARAEICIAPLLIGSGLKIKLVEALSYGKATVSTSIGIQGLEDWASGVVEVADDAEGFAAGMVKLLSDQVLRQEREAAALKLVDDHYSEAAALSPEFISAVLRRHQFEK